jgi:hypothetical protein
MRRSLPVALLIVLPAAGAAQVATVEVTPASATVTAGGTLQLRAVARDAAGRAVEAVPVVWAATPFDAAAVDSTGLLTAFRQGIVQVFALVAGRPGVARVEIEPKPPARIALAADRPDIVVGGTAVVTGVAMTEDGEPLRQAVISYRSSDERIATVDAAGVVIGRAEGAAVITARAGGAVGELRVRVVPNTVARLSVHGAASARTGDVVRLTAEGRTAADAAVAAPPVRWSVSGPGAAVWADGAFVAERPGTYLVTATLGGASAAHAIAVTQRTHARRFELYTHVGFGDIQAAEVWPVNNALYVSTLSDRLYAFDISTPGSPVRRDSLIVDARVINDVSTTPDGRIGVLTREGASSRRNGLVFLDLSDPLRPGVLSEYTATLTGGVHSAFIDGHHVYATDNATGSLRIISFADPRAPREVARWEVPEPVLVEIEADGNPMLGGRYLHDVYVKDGIAYLAYWRHGLVILDVGAGLRGGSPERPVLVSRFTYNVADYYPPDMLAGTHEVVRYGDYVFMADEVFPAVFDLDSRDRIASLGRVHVLDVRDIERPVKVAEYNVQDKGSHNIWIEDDVMFIGYYEGGIRAVDVSGELRGDLMAQGREIGAIWTGSPAGFRPNLPMAWGARPHRGFVYGSDINSGLWVARLAPARIIP